MDRTRRRLLIRPPDAARPRPNLPRRCASPPGPSSPSSAARFAGNWLIITVDTLCAPLSNPGRASASRTYGRNFPKVYAQAPNTPAFRAFSDLALAFGSSLRKQSLNFAAHRQGRDAGLAGWQRRA